MTLWMLITSVIILTGFRKHQGPQLADSKKPEPVEVMIADETAFQSEKGQDSIQVMVSLSQTATEPVEVDYSTENGTAISGVDYVATKGTIIFKPGEIVKEINVLIIGEVAADPDEDAESLSKINFKINLTRVRNAIIKNRAAIITIIKNISRDPRFWNTKLSAYLVQFKFTGFTTFSGDASVCPVSKNGQVVLSGILYGNENAGRYDPIMYRGLLYLKIRMDICSIEAGTGPNGEDEYCGMRVRFTGNVNTELEIDTTTEQGGYIQFQHDPATDRGYFRDVTGGCLSQIPEETQMVPNKTIASIFNGFELKFLRDLSTGRLIRTLRRDTYYNVDDDGNITEVRVIRKIQ